MAWLRQQPALRRMPEAGGQRARAASAGKEVSTGFAELDALLAGGFPSGGIVELTGVGRTSLALAAVAAATQRGELAAWIDPADALDPRSWEATGGCSELLLWVRPQVTEEEQVPRPGESPDERRARQRQQQRRQERALMRQAFKAVDLVLEAGGFSLVVIDLALPHLVLPRGARGSGARGAQQSALKWWVRLARKVEHAQAALVVVGDGGSFNSTMRLQCTPTQGWGHGFTAEVVRHRHTAPGQRVRLRLAPPVD